MSTVQDFAEWNTNELHGRTCQKSGAAKHILDADCRYEEGTFALFSLPCKLPRLFTLRFTAPADFTPGDVITLKGRQFAFKTRTMEEPKEKLFSTGAVVQCDIDMERDFAFFAAGGGEQTTGGLPSGVVFQTENINVYIDPDGDDSPNNPGTTDSPFKTFAGAHDAVSQKYIFTSRGSLIYNINPGTYELDAQNKHIMCSATHPQAVIVQASDPGNKPLLVADYFSMGGGNKQYANLRLAASIGSVVSTNFCNVTLQDIELITQAANMRFLFPYCGAVGIQNSLTVDGGGYAAESVFYNYALLSGANNSIRIQNLPSVRWFAFCGFGRLALDYCTFTGSTTGSRYYICQNGVIDLNGASTSFFPGTTAGAIRDNGSYV